MYIIRYSLLIACFLAGCQIATFDIPVADGWRLPTKKGKAGDWEAYSKSGRPVHQAPLAL
jgi:hypothetical protein